jgi:hypothetical protein
VVAAIKTPSIKSGIKNMFEKKVINREVRISNNADTSASEEDVKIALDMEKNGTPIPDSLKDAVEQYKKNQNPPHKENEEEPEPKETHDPAEDEEEETEELETPPKNDAEKSKKEIKKEGESEDLNKEKKPPDEGKKNVVPSNQMERPIRAMPIGKFNKIKENWEKEKEELLSKSKDLETQVQNLTKAFNEGNQKKVDDRINELAEKTGLEGADLKALIEVIKSEVKIPDDILKKIQEKSNDQPTENAEDKEKKVWSEQDKQFDSEFESALNDNGADKSMEKYKDKIKELAFTDGYQSKSVWELWTRFIKPKYVNKKAPPENPSGNPSTLESKNWEEIAKDPQKIRDLSTKEAEEFTEYMASKSTREIRRR